MFVATTPFAVNSFLLPHIEVLSKHYEITLCVNVAAYELTPRVCELVQVIDIRLERKISLLSDLRSWLGLLLVIARIDPVVIHSITPKAGLLAMLAGCLLRVSNRWHTFTGQVWVNQKGIKRYFFKAIDRLIVLLASRVFADSASQCRLLRDEGVVREGEINLLGSGSIAGVDLGRFHPDSTRRNVVRKQNNTGADICVFLFVGRLARDKGVFDLVNAFQQVAAAVPDIELWVVGPDEEGLLPALQETAIGCGAPIRWLGATPTPEHFMMAADILLLPSYREGFGSVIIEGAACGIPAIAYRIHGVVDAVADGSSGLLVEVGRLAALAGAMQTLAQNGDLRRRLGYQARERAEHEFSSQSVTEAWSDYYRSQLSRE